MIVLQLFVLFSSSKKAWFPTCLNNFLVAVARPPNVTLFCFQVRGKISKGQDVIFEENVSGANDMLINLSKVAELERDTKEAQTKMHDSLHERNFLQVQLDKLEAEKNEMQKRLAITTQERNSLENQVAELQDLSR